MMPSEGEGSDRADRVLIAGAGSLGTVYGAYLARAGAQVQLLARGRHADAITTRGGVTIVGVDGQEQEVALAAVSDPSEVVAYEVLILLSKTTDTQEILSSLGEPGRALQTAVSLQNGLDKDDELARWCGASRVIGGASMVGGVLREPGVVHHTFAGPTFLGELDGSASARVQALASMLEAGGLAATVSDDIRSVEWTKVLQVLPAMTLTALTRRPYHEVMLVPELACSFVRLIREAGQIAEREGIRLANWPQMIPVAAVVEATEQRGMQIVTGFGRELLRRGETSVRPSMLQSIETGRRLEVDAIHGYLVQCAREYGIDVPTLAVTYDLLKGVDRLHAGSGQEWAS